MELITQKEWLDRVNELTSQRDYYLRAAERLRRDADDVLSERDALRARVGELEEACDEVERGLGPKPAGTCSDGCQQEVSMALRAVRAAFSGEAPPESEAVGLVRECRATIVHTLQCYADPDPDHAVTAGCDCIRCILEPTRDRIDAFLSSLPEPDAGEPAMPKHTCMDNIPGTAEARGPECCDACAGEPADEDCADCTCDATGQCKWHQSQEECHPECSCEECGGSGKSFAHCENGEPGPDCPAGCVRGEDGIYREPAEPCERCGGSPGTECDECIGGEE